jgi:hypothetical protein
MSKAEVIAPRGASRGKRLNASCSEVQDVEGLKHRVLRIRRRAMMALAMADQAERCLVLAQFRVEQVGQDLADLKAVCSSRPRTMSRAHRYTGWLSRIFGSRR